MSEENQHQEEEAETGLPIKFIPGRKNVNELYVRIPSAYHETRIKATALGMRRMPEGATWQIPFLHRERNVERLTATALDEQVKLAEKRAEREQNPGTDPISTTDRVKARDEHRIPVLAGSISEGATATLGDRSFEAAYVSPEFDLTEASAANMNERFGTSFAAGDLIAYAYDEVPESVLAKRAKEAEAEADSPAP